VSAFLDGLELPPSRYGAAPPRVVEAPVAGLGEAVVGLGARRVLLVTDAGLVSAGVADRVRASLLFAGLFVERFEGVEPEPGEDVCESAADLARRWDADAVVGLGGGSCLDVAKAAALLCANGGAVSDWWGEGKRAPADLLPIIAVPTTAGTGSEVQSHLLISRRGDGVKMAVGHPTAMPRLVWLDATLLPSAPRAVRLQAGVDALTHAMEAAVSLAASEAASTLALAALRRVWGALPSVVAGDADRATWRALQVGSVWAGAAIEGGMLGAAHALANPLSATLGVPHGLAVGMTLPGVLALHVARAPAAAQRLAEALGVDAVALPAVVSARLAALHAPARPTGWDGGGIDGLVAAARSQWTLRFNPAPLSDADLRGVYEGIAAARA
jgi:alcohol dehydrogenase